MGKFDGIYLVSDLDGTLLDNEKYEISEENIRAIKRFMAEGGLFGFATGRIVRELREFEELIGTNAPSVTCNGSLVYDFSSGKHSIVGEIKDDILPFLEYVEKSFPHVMIDLTTDNVVYYYRPNSSLRKHMSISSAEFCEVADYRLSPRPWMKLAIWDEPDRIKNFAEKADRSRLSADYSFMYSFEYCCEISARIADKGSALLEAKKLLGGVKKVVAIGDNENDATMLKNADLSMVPSNAVEAARKNADIILECDCNHSAVAFAIDKIEKML